jgi:hypothetical protein
MGLSFTIAAGPRQRSHSQVRVPKESWPHSTVSDSRRPEAGGPGPRIYILQERGGPVISPCTGSLFVASYDSQGYGGCVRSPLHTGSELANLIFFEIIPRRGPQRKHRSSIVAGVFVSVETYLWSRCLETCCITPLFHWCVRVCCGRYLATAAVYRVNA